MAKTNMIKAECHSDDRAVEVEFNAERWFRHATNEEIKKLAGCEWGGDYPADNVAIETAGWNSSVADMFKYIEFRRKIEDCGFECHVNSEDALAWIKKNRKCLYDELVATTLANS